MGEVYRARDSRLGREVAVKVLPELLAEDAEGLARLEQEARALASAPRESGATPRLTPPQSSDPVLVEPTGFSSPQIPNSDKRVAFQDLHRELVHDEARSRHLCSDCHRVFLTLPISWRGTVAQYAGRLHGCTKASATSACTTTRTSTS